jgi:hypothetical protein
MSCSLWTLGQGGGENGRHLTIREKTGLGVHSGDIGPAQGKLEEGTHVIRVSETQAGRIVPSP